MQDEPGDDPPTNRGRVGARRPHRGNSVQQTPLESEVWPASHTLPQVMTHASGVCSRQLVIQILPCALHGAITAGWEKGRHPHRESLAVRVFI